MNATRIAIAATLVCVGVMLTSACGYLILPFIPKTPTVDTLHFVLVQANRVGEPALVAFGNVGSSDFHHFYGGLNTMWVDCPQASTFRLTGTLTGKPSRLKLTGNNQDGQSVDFEGNATYRIVGNRIEDLQISGTLTKPPGCHATDTVQTPFAPTPFEPLDRHFQGSATLSKRETLQIDAYIHEQNFSLTGDYFGEGAIGIRGSPCFASGRRKLRGYTQNIAARSLKEVFTMDDGSTVIAVVARPAWLGQRSLPLTLPTHFTVEGGKCNGQTFDSVLQPSP